MRNGRTGSIWGGALAGLVGGVVLWLFFGIVTVSQGGSIWAMFKVAATPFLGESALRPGFDAGPVLAGIFVHFLVAAFWGSLFGLLFYGFSRGNTILAGAAWGVVVWILMYYVILPLVGMAEVVDATPVWIAFVGHLLYGLGVGWAFLPSQHTVVTPEEPPVRRRGPPVTP